MTAHPAEASFSEFAKIASCKPSYVTELRKSNRLLLTDDGKRVRVAESLQRIKDTADPARRAVAQRHAVARDAKAAGEGAPLDDDIAAADPSTAQFQTSRAEREHWAAKTAKLEYEKNIGKMLDADHAEAAMAKSFTVLRSRLELLCDSLPPLFAPITDETRIRAMLQDEVEQALNELSRQFTALSKGAA